MAELKFDDGKVVKLSEETTNRLREELCKPVIEQLVVDRFRAIDDGDGFVRIAIMPDEVTASKWDERLYGNAGETHLLNYDEARKVANGLLKMIGD